MILFVQKYLPIVLIFAYHFSTELYCSQIFIDLANFSLMQLN